jgi:alkylation response protein AidB-like acyl-CoA dehydrogenase
MLDHTDPNALIVETARRFAQERLAPGAAAREKAGRIEPEIVRELGEMGFLGATLSARWDGSEIDTVTYARVVEEIAAGDGSVSTLVSVHNAPTCEILQHYGTDAQREEWLRPMATGAAVGSFALTEPGAGSEASALRTRAMKDGDDYIITGSKQFISNAAIGQTTILFAMTDPAAGKKGMSCFIVHNNTPGYQVARVEEKLGQKASDTCHLVFDGMRVPAAQRIGAEGEGYKIALSTLEAGRIGIAAQSVGMARAALDYAIGYAKERRSFGKPIIDHQAVGFRLVEAKTKLEASRQLVLNAARLKDAGQPALEAAAMAKLFASEAAEAICTAAIQTLGGYGFLCDYPVERIYRDVRVCQIYEGTSDIQKIILQRML